MIEVRIAMTGAGWPIGSAVRVDLPAARQAAGLMVPRDAVIVRSDGAHVFRVGRGDLAERIAVRVGNGDSERVEVTGSLAAGDRVIVRGAERLRPGQPVKVAAGAGNKAAAALEVPRG
jgi:multidrug efflux pump subunit AcrA (membrane-fusion protein)